MCYHHYRFCSAAAVAFDQKMKSQLEDIRQAGTWKAERVITTPQAAAISVENRTDSILNFCANNYLGLSVISLTSKNFVIIILFFSNLIMFTSN